jgi:hypothetical protein
MLDAPIECESERSPQTAHAEMVEALLAGEGLARVAEIAEACVGTRVGIYLPRPGSDGGEGDAAERYVAVLVAGGDAVRPAAVTEVVPIVAHGEIQGAVLMFGEGCAEASDYLGVAAVASLTGVAVLNAREDASQPGDRGLIAELLGEREVRASEIVRRAGLHGCDLSDGVVALCVDPGDAVPGMLIAAIAAERPGTLTELCGERLYVLLPGGAEAQRLTDLLGERARVALSSRYRQAAEARHALTEAHLLLTLVEAGGHSSTDRPTWDTVRLLFRTFVADPDELARFSERSVGALVRHDARYGSELQATYWAYQESDCNMNVAAKATYTHRHTVANRLARIEELTGLDPSRSHDRELLSLALKAHLVVILARGGKLPTQPGR